MQRRKVAELFLCDFASFLYVKVTHVKLFHMEIIEIRISA